MIEIILGVIIIVLIVVNVYTVKIMQEQIKSLTMMVKAETLTDYKINEERETEVKEQPEEEYIATDKLSDEDFEKLVLKNGK